MYRFARQTRHLIENVSVKDCGYHVSTVEVGEGSFHLCVFEVVCGRARYETPAYSSFSRTVALATIRHIAVARYVAEHLHLSPEVLGLLFDAADKPTLKGLRDVALGVSCSAFQ